MTVKINKQCSIKCDVLSRFVSICTTFNNNAYTYSLILKRDWIPPNWDILQFFFLRMTIKPSMYNFGISLTITTEERRQSPFSVNSVLVGLLNFFRMLYLHNTLPIFINWPNTQLSGEYVASSLMYGNSGSTCPCNTAAMYLKR